MARARHRQGFPCCHHPPLPCVPPSLPRRSRPVRASLASRPVAAFPVIRAGRPPRCPFRGLLDVHCALRPTWSLSRPRRPVAPECFSRSRYLLQPLRLLPAGATVAGRVSKPAEGQRLSTAHRISQASVDPPHSTYPNAAARLCDSACWQSQLLHTVPLVYPHGFTVRSAQLTSPP